MSENTAMQAFLDTKPCPKCGALGIMQLTGRCKYSNPLQHEWQCACGAAGDVGYEDMRNDKIEFVMPKTVEVMPLGSMKKLLPPPEGHCRICAVKHEPELPHNAQSLFYQMRFRMRYGRDGTWADALAHCTPKMQAFWKKGIQLKGAWTQPPEGVEVISEPIDG